MLSGFLQVLVSESDCIADPKGRNPTRDLKQSRNCPLAEF